MTSLADRLKALGVRTVARTSDRADRPINDTKPRPLPSHRAHSVEQVLPGRLVNTPHGETFLVETSYPLDQRHGCASLRLNASLRFIADWACEPRLATGDARGLAFLDTETTGLAGGVGTYAFLVGVGQSDGESFRLTQFFLREPGEEEALLSALSERLGASSALVTFNGKGFDVPLLDARYITNGRSSPLPPLAHLDLLPLARRLWRDRLPSRALGSLEQYILRVSRTHEDVPGWMIPQLYLSYVRTGDARPLKSVFYHNAMDVLSMAALLSHIAEMLDDPLDWADRRPMPASASADRPSSVNRPSSVGAHPLDLLGMGRLFESLQRFDLAVPLYERALDRDVAPVPHHAPLATALRQRIVQRLSFIQKRRGNWPAAIDLWREAAGEGEIYAHVELAKYYEHRMHDLDEAARWTMAALGRVTAPDYPHNSRQRWLVDLQHRLARVRRKASQEPPASERSTAS